MTLLREYREKAERLKEHIVFRSLASAEELAAYWPGGAENPGKDVRAWIFCWANLMRMFGRIEDRRVEQEQDDSRVQQLVSEALSDTPEIVELSGGSVVSVYPKAFDALTWVRDREWEIDWLVERRDRLRARGAFAENPRLLERVRTMIVYEYHLLAWAVTHHDVYLPFPPADPPEDVPEQIARLTTKDLERIRLAHLHVNAVSIALLSRYLSQKASGDPSAEKGNWNVFFSQLGDAHHVSTVLLRRERSLRSEIGQALQAADAHERAMQAAKAKADAEAKQRRPGGRAMLPQ
ncbi:MAG TPA: hypothetical protein VFN76_10005 [Candidatus Limnocylindria bacterium]|nr:hypothetical protein [Candidatus Limnocylindria bacterium]